MAILDLVFPRKCLNCGKDGSYLCAKCTDNIKELLQICPVCERFSISGKTHARCTSFISCNGLFSVWPYKGVIRKALIALKYKFAYEIAQEISDNLTRKLSKTFFINLKNPILIPIPLHTLRKNWRGFNQTEVMGKIIAERFNWRFEPGFLVRRKIISPQTGLGKMERKENVKGVFGINNKIINARYSTLILFDDVWTTGSTIKEAAVIIKRNYQNPVWSLTVAR
ncbi:MAG TPA: double zinc ribbon domain-containing protein [Patescibacteria group bacterium]|nr:double zinc ribbon domain-containing protein [Patescibacteria group bacterium]